MHPGVTPAISAVITVPWVRGSILGLRFGTPVPTQVRLCYHPQHDHWLEFADGTRADVVASRFPDEIRQARIEMMTSYSRRESITTTFRRRKSEVTAKPTTTSVEARPRLLREGTSQMTATEAIRRAARGGTVAPAETAVEPAAEPTPAAADEPAAADDPFEVFDRFSAPAGPPPKGVTTSSVFAADRDQTTRRIRALRAARLRDPGAP